VVLVVGVRLGCINHALLTAAAIDSAGVPFAGWVANHIDPHMLHASDTVQCLTERLTGPLLGRIDYAHDADAAGAASLLDMHSLLAHVHRVRVR
jgi:dethiobiotin synthetase